MGQPTQPTCRLFSLLPSWPLLPVPLLAPWLLPLAMPPQTLLSLQCTLTSMVSMMTTVEQTSSRLSPEMVTPPLAATLSLFLMAGSRLSSMLTMEMESSKMSPMREFLSMDLLLSRLLLLVTLWFMLLLTQLLLLVQFLMLLLTQLPSLIQLLLLTQLLLPTQLPMLLLPLSSMVKQQIVIY